MNLSVPFVVIFLIGVISLTAGIPDYSATIRPPAFPLAVRNPYVNVWLPRNELPGNWPVFWNGATKGWTGLVKVDNVPYIYMGSPIGFMGDRAIQLGSAVTPTKSHFFLRAGPVDLNVTFFSPVEVKDMKKQSIPLSHVFITVASNDGANHVAQVYMDISGEWATSDTSRIISWTQTSTPSGLRIWSTQLESQIVFGEYSEYPTWGRAVLITSRSASYASGSDIEVRSTFVANGFLGNTNDETFRCAECDWPVFGFAQNLGLVSASAPKEVQFVVGHIREPAVNWIGTSQKALWAEYWANAEEMIDFFWSDTSVSLVSADALDAKLLNDAFASGGQFYADIIALSLRQAYGANEFAGNLTHPYLYQKEISSGAFINTVDVIYPAAPMYYYLGVEYLRYLLDPLFYQMEHGFWTEEYSAHDIGDLYPNATGNGYSGPMPIEESANMIMMVANIVFHPETPVEVGRAYVLSHYPILTQWANYLFHNCLYPVDQLTTDDFIGHTELNSGLALKGILGMSTFAKISGFVGNTTAEQFYNAAVQSFVPIWLNESMHVDGDHLKMEYNVTNGYQFKYNAFHDRLFGLNVVPAEIYKMEADFYLSKLEPYGIPFVNRHDYTKSDWEIWTAAAFGEASPALRTALIEALGKFLRVTAQRVPFTDWYVTATSNQVGFQARPVAGGHFAILALDTAIDAR